MNAHASFLFLFMFVVLGSFAWADVPQEPAEGGEAWMLTLDTIKAKTQELMVRNTELAAEYNMLAQDINTVEASIVAQSAKNAEMADFLKIRHGRSDQQMQWEDIGFQIKDKQQQLNDAQKDLDGLKVQAAALENKAKLKRLRISEWELRENSRKAQPVPAAEDNPLAGLRKQIQDEKSKEVRLEADLARLSDGRPSPDAAGDALERELASLRRQKDALQARAEGKGGADNTGRIADVTRTKTELEAKIRDLEGGIEKMQRSTQEISAGDIQRKKIIRDIVEADNANQDLRKQVKHLREDIAVLKDSIGKLERRGIALGKNKTQ